MTSTPGSEKRIDPKLADQEHLEQTDVEGALEQDPEQVPNADYSNPDTRPAKAPDESAS